MPLLVIISFTLITIALIFYSIGVWAEKLANYLRAWHVVCFWLGLSFDVAGTLAMHFLAEGPFDITEPHTLTGQLALWLMLMHAIWASFVAVKGSKKSKMNFHRYSIAVWFIWLIPYFGGVYIGITG